MKLAGAVLGFLILAGVFVVWIRMYRSIKGDDAPLFSFGTRKEKKQGPSLEDFIASYKRGDAGVAAPAAAPAPARTPATPALASMPSPAPASVPSPPAAAAKRDAFISGATKLVYLACKTGLRDHHVFAHVQLAVLSTGGEIDPSLAGSTLDLVICNAAMSPVAVIDIVDASGTPPISGKTEHLRTLGIRYLRLSAKSLPRPDEFHALLYKM